MSGTAVRVIKRVTLVYGNPQAASSAGPETTLASNINVAQFREFVAMARLHAATWGASPNAKLDLRIRASAPTDEDPAQTFRTAGAELAKLTFTRPNAGPLLVMSAPVTGFGTHVDITAQFTQGTVLNEPSTLSTSMDISLKS